MDRDIHRRTDDLFEKLLAKTSEGDAKQILKAIHWQCILIEEMSAGQQALQETTSDGFTLQKDVLDRIADRLAE